MKLIVTDHGDPSVGIFPETWQVDAPHDCTEEEGRELFRDLILQAYAEFCEGRLTAEYEYEIEAEAREEQAIDNAIEPFNYGDIDFNNM